MNLRLHIDLFFGRIEIDQGQALRIDWGLIKIFWNLKPTASQKKIHPLMT